MSLSMEAFHCKSVCHHRIKFGSHRHCGTVDIMVLVCHVNSQDHAIKRSSAFIARSPSR